MTDGEKLFDLAFHPRNVFYLRRCLTAQLLKRLPKDLRATINLCEEFQDLLQDPVSGVDVSAYCGADFGSACAKQCHSCLVAKSAVHQTVPLFLCCFQVPVQCSAAQRSAVQRTAERCC